MKDKYKNVYFIGIGGVSMSGLASMLRDKGAIVSGSDQTKSEICEKLEQQGIKVNYEHKKENITYDITLLVYNSAIKDSNEEIKEAKNKGIELISRAELLGEYIQEFEKSICISGTHGKTTTSALTSSIFLQTDKDPTISVGGKLAQIDGYFKLGKKEVFIVESCEYSNNFHNFYPTTAVIMNIELDHTDFFNSIEDVYKSFNGFAKNCKEHIIINSDIKNYETVLVDINDKVKVTTYGLNSGQYRATNIQYNKSNTTFSITKDDEFLCDIRINLNGEYNVLNALSAFVASIVNGVDVDTCVDGLLKYEGIARRFQFKGEKDNITVYDDYAHHPTACNMTLSSIKKLGFDRTICIFQPHTYSRTKGLFTEFANAFKDADKLYLVDIFPARETDTLGMSSELLCEEINKVSGNAVYCESFDKCLEEINKELKENDCLVTMGAGLSYTIGEQFLNQEQ